MVEKKINENLPVPAIFTNNLPKDLRKGVNTNVKQKISLELRIPHAILLNEDSKINLNGHSGAKLWVFQIVQKHIYIAIIVLALM